MNAITKLSPEAINALAEKALEKMPVVDFAFWANARRREGKQDPQFTGTLKISTVKVAEMLAAALERGDTELTLFADLWQNEAVVGKDRPKFSGRANTRVVPRSEAQDAE
jgi:hypothetical protein